MVRAKFRCLHVTKSWDGKARAEFGPVMPKNKDVWQPDDPKQVSEENRSFWEATPTGELEIWYRDSKDAPEPGSYTYIDMEEGDGLWTLDSVTDHGNLNAEVTLWMSHQKEGPVSSAKLTMNIHNGKASKVFIGRAKSKWSVVFVAAE